jgi:site-specific DNA-methyltransferase (adenine-specific)
MTGLLHIVVARKPIEGTIVENCLQWGCGALNIDGCRIGTGEEPILCHRGVQKNKNVYGDYAEAYDYSGRKYRNSGRWPANLIHSGSPEVVTLFPMTGGESKPRTLRRNKPTSGWSGGSQQTDNSGSVHCDAGGSASRFFYNFSEQESDE